MKAKIKVWLKKSILDPQGKAVLHAVQDMEYKSISDIRVGKYIEMTFDTTDKNLAAEQTEQLCKQLLTNPIMENFEYEIEED